MSSDPLREAQRISALAILSGTCPPPGGDDLTPFDPLANYVATVHPECVPGPGYVGADVHYDAGYGLLAFSVQGICSRYLTTVDVDDLAHSAGLIASVMTLQDAADRHARRLAEAPHRGGLREKCSMRAALEATTALARLCDIVLAETGDASALARNAAWAEGRQDDHPALTAFAVGARALLATGWPGPTFVWYPEIGCLEVHAIARRDGQAILDRAAALQDGDKDRAGIVRRATPTGRRGPHPGPGPVDHRDPGPEDEPAFEAKPPKALTLVVFPDLSHLPGKPKTTGATYTHQSPLAEHGHLAKVALPLSEAPDLRVFVEALDREFPWYRDVTRVLAADLGRGTSARFRNALLHGRPGSAKTRYARRAMELAGLPVLVYSAGGTADATFGSTSRQWSTGRLSTPAGLIARMQRANVGLVLDELDKVPPPGTGHNGRLDEVLLPFLEPDSARAVHDTYVEAPLDLSAVSYLATANDLGRVPGPLRDRFRLIEAPLPRPEDLPALVRSMTAEIMVEQGLDAAWGEPLAQDELDLLATAWRGGSLRGLRRMVEVMLDGRPAGLAQ
ncbi:AAA family ATPase [Methylobacterium sp. E-005]|uniref:AAA family ATPase n=1 Tax=Methylobacterium sp. E-005 TaxID=2836549 RepID=UPI001FB8C277|nr:AAA family ATPase [Methylobacterium sp. E-005]MCJ2088543.1 AAA family ATPase [Methylobacterium sp. E-005]